MPPSTTTHAWTRAALVVTAIAVFSAGAVFGLERLHRATASTQRDASDAARSGSDRALARVTVTRDFGVRAVASGGPESTDGTVMDALKGVAEVETAYGGGFVNAIDGISSGYTGGGGQQSDWFYYVNGLLADRGAGDYRLRVGERVWWDFHRWGEASAPAVVGQYPEPFAHGYDGRALPTTVVYAEGLAPIAEQVAAALRGRGVASVRAVVLTRGLTPPAGEHVILLGAFPQLSQLSWLADTAAHPAQGGLFATFSAGDSRVTDATGKPTTLPAAGAVLATARADAPGATIWLVTGSTDADARRAASLLAEQPEELTGRFAVLVPRDGASRPLPLEGAR